MIAKIVNDIPDGLCNFVPSEYNSVDNLTRIKTVNELVNASSTWFKPHPKFDQTGISVFDRVQIIKLRDNEAALENELKVAKELSSIAKNDINQIVQGILDKNKKSVVVPKA